MSASARGRSLDCRHVFRWPGGRDEPVAGDNPDGLLVLIGRRFTAGELIRSLNAFGIDDVTAREAAVVQANVPSHSDHDVATVHVQRAAIK
jgi:hypothetical protein